MATVIPNIEKPVVIYSKAYELVKYIALNGNYSDIVNLMSLLCAYTKVFTTGQVPALQKVRGGIQESAVEGLKSVLTGATIQTNAIHDFNHMRDNFFRQIAIRYPSYDKDIKTIIGQRGCLTTLDFFGEFSIVDCEGTELATGNTAAEYIDIWNNQKVPADYAICGTVTPYYFPTYVNEKLVGQSWINPDNDTILYNAPHGVQNHGKREIFNAFRKDIVDNEASIQPQALAKYSNKEL